MWMGPSMCPVMMSEESIFFSVRVAKAMPEVGGESWITLRVMLETVAERGFGEVGGGRVMWEWVLLEIVISCSGEAPD